MSNVTNDNIQAGAGQLAQEGEYWMERFAEVPEKAFFPYDKKAVSGVSANVETMEFQFSPDLCARVMKLRNNSDPRLFMILAAGVVTVLNKYAGLSDLVVGAPIYKQEVESGEEGEFINTILPLRARLETGMTFKDLLLKMRQAIIDGDKNQNFPMRTLLHKLGLPVTETDFPLFDVALLLDNVHDRRYLEPLQPGIVFAFSREDESVKVTVEYDFNRYEQRTVEGMIRHFVTLLEKALTDVNEPLAQLDMFAAEERDQLLNAFNDTSAEFPMDKTLHRLIEEQVDKSPDAVAVFHKGNTLTYRQLNEKANRMAGLLRAKGMGAGSIVGLLMERSTDMVVAMLSVIKAGAAYLPIDPAAPRNRVLAILKDSRASLLITQTGHPLKDAFSYTALQGLNDRLIKPFYTPPRKQIKDLDRLPIPNRSLVDYEKYNQYIGQVMVKNVISLQTARGCPYDCAYCSKIWSRKHVFRSADDIFAELQLYYDMGIRRFSIFDDIFNVNRENGLKLFKKVIDSGMKIQFFFPNGMRGDLLDKEYIDMAVEAGLCATALALETASPRMQKLINKNLNLDIFRENVEYFCKKHPHVILELFSMHGFPTETEAEARMTMDFIKAQRWLHFPYVFILKIYPNTEMAELAMNHGVHREDILKSEDLAFHELSPTSPFKRVLPRITRPNSSTITF